ncbi:kelch-like protein 38 [Xenopus laevis]|uniref:Kelch-like protein 38 n=1 Tax=Xenopus laevis TaxID=8355 RepID=A0A8J1L310_XENLA|nr:kelch-like protein 38 [Xenopus laevis]
MYLFGGEDVTQNPVRLIQKIVVPNENQNGQKCLCNCNGDGDKIIIVRAYTKRIIAYKAEQVYEMCRHEECTMVPQSYRISSMLQGVDV